MFRSSLECSTHGMRPFFWIVVIGIFLTLLSTNFILKSSRKIVEKKKKIGLCRYSQENAANQAALPQLLSEEFFIRMLSARSPPRGDLFDPPIKGAELRAILQLLWKFLDLCEKHNIEVFMYGGTLLGSYRHHGIIPWDDDLDLLMNNADQVRLNKAMKGDPDWNIKIEQRNNSIWRLSRKSACLHVTHYGCWPFIDMSFYNVQNGWVMDLVNTNYRYPVNFTFPLHKRPFMGRWVNSPRDSFKFLSFLHYSLDMCVSLQFSHKFARAPKAPLKSIKCTELVSTYPFVFRVTDSPPSCRGNLETLRFQNGEPLYTVPVDEPVRVINTESSTLRHRT